MKTFLMIVGGIVIFVGLAMAGFRSEGGQPVMDSGAGGFRGTLVMVAGLGIIIFAANMD